MAQPAETTPTHTSTGPSTGTPTAADEQPLAVDALVEDVSIDGMCGVY